MILNDYLQAGRILAYPISDYRPRATVGPLSIYLLHFVPRVTITRALSSVVARCAVAAFNGAEPDVSSPGSLLRCMKCQPNMIMSQLENIDI